MPDHFVVRRGVKISRIECNRFAREDAEAVVAMFVNRMRPNVKRITASRGVGVDTGPRAYDSGEIEDHSCYASVSFAFRGTPDGG